VFHGGRSWRKQKRIDKTNKKEIEKKIRKIENGWRKTYERQRARKMIKQEELYDTCNDIKFIIVWLIEFYIIRHT
jgi:hypothetical protein